MLLAVYLFVPFAFMGAAERSGTHSIEVLRDVGARGGKWVSIDRGRFANGTLTTFAGEKITLEWPRPEPALYPFGGEKITRDDKRLDHPAVVSVRGVFADAKTLRVKELHEHGFERDGASYAGLALVAIAWLWPVLRRPVRNPG